jgi:hypothetical protein
MRAEFFRLFDVETILMVNSNTATFGDVTDDGITWNWLAATC